MSMLSRKELIEKNDEKYKLMLEQVNIPDFTKCVAAMANISITDVNDEVICRYLSTWAESKYDFFTMFGNKTSVDYRMVYKEETNDVDSQDYILNEIRNRFPVFNPWLEAIFGDSYAYKYNKISENEVDLYAFYTYVEKYLNKDYDSLKGQKITTFLQRELGAPEELLTEIAKIWENRTFNGYITASIDPVDIMLASENPYKWRSCYALDGGGHSDGCLAAVLDNSSIITYTWDKQGKFKLLDEYDLKNIKYKQKRAFIEFNPERTLMHLNKIYPQKNFSDEFENTWIKTVTQFLNKEVTKIEEQSFIRINRVNPYGYSEDRFGASLYRTPDYQESSLDIHYYNNEIECPDGCGDTIPGTDSCEWDWEGDRLIAEEFYMEEEEEEEEPYYCPIIEDYCYSYEGDDECHDCALYKEYYTKCENDHSKQCQRPFELYIEEVEDDFFVQEYNEDHCKGCPLAKYHCGGAVTEKTITEPRNTTKVYEIPVDAYRM